MQCKHAYLSASSLSLNTSLSCFCENHHVNLPEFVVSCDTSVIRQRGQILCERVQISHTLLALRTALINERVQQSSRVFNFCTSVTRSHPPTWQYPKPFALCLRG